MDEVKRITRTDNPAISEITLLSMAKMMGHKKSLSGFVMRFE
jgi:hypothetical protein